MKNKTNKQILRPNKRGILRPIELPSNSGAVQRYELRMRGTVIHSGGTRFGKFPKDK